MADTKIAAEIGAEIPAASAVGPGAGAGESAAEAVEARKHTERTAIRRTEKALESRAAIVHELSEREIRFMDFG
jgi:hypothetical protein